MKNIIWYIIISFIIVVLFTTAYFVNDISNNFKKSEAFQTVIDKIINNETNIPIADGKFEVSYIIGGKLNSKVAHFHFKVYTQNKKFVVYADLIKNDSNAWEISDFEAKER